MAKAKKQQSSTEPTSAAAAPAASDQTGAAEAPAGGKASAAAKPSAKKSAASKAVGPKAGKAAAKSQAPQSAKPAAPAVPLIDTSLAAQTAAKLVANRDLLGGTRESQPSSATESSSFRQLKESLNKPASQAPAAFLHNTAPHKKLNLPFGGLKQAGRNQTFGADVNRAGVPRRTGG